MAKKRTNIGKAETPRRRTPTRGGPKFSPLMGILGVGAGWVGLELIDELPLIGNFIKKRRALGKPVTALVFLILGLIAIYAYSKRSKWSSFLTGLSGGVILKGAADKAAAEEQGNPEKVSGAMPQLAAAFADASDEERAEFVRVLGFSPTDISPAQLRRVDKAITMDGQARWELLK